MPSRERAAITLMAVPKLKSLLVLCKILHAGPFLEVLLLTNFELYLQGSITVAALHAANLFTP